MSSLDEIRDSKGEVPAYAWPGLYPIVYITADAGYLCAACVNGGNGSRAAEKLDPKDHDDDQWRVVAYEAAEAPASEIRCDHCNTIIAGAVDDE